MQVLTTALGCTRRYNREAWPALVEALRTLRAPAVLSARFVSAARLEPSTSRLPVAPTCLLFAIVRGQ